MKIYPAWFNMPNLKLTELATSVSCNIRIDCAVHRYVSRYESPHPHLSLPFSHFPGFRQFSFYTTMLISELNSENKTFGDAPSKVSLKSKTISSLKCLQPFLTQKQFFSVFIINLFCLLLMTNIIRIMVMGSNIINFTKPECKRSAQNSRKKINSSIWISLLLLLHQFLYSSTRHY